MLTTVLVLMVGFFGHASAAGSWSHGPARGGSSWGYGPTHGGVYGPADWGHVSSYCNGRSQSPINIVRDDVEDDDDDDNSTDLRVVFQNPDGFVTGTFVNNGHSPTLSVSKTQGGASVINPDNGQKYILEQFHFHFGCTDNVGSEHTVDGKSYPGEVHLVFFNAKYGDLGTAATKSDGLTVIGAFLTKSNTASQELASLSRSLPNIKIEGSKVNGVTVKLDHLVPGLSSGTRSYYTYKGSLTTPGCYETVSWLVLRTPISADQEVLNNFRALQSVHGYSNGLMCNNYRPTLPLNGREVYLHE